jgi:P-type Ca2+ transporter type 2C
VIREIHNAVPGRVRLKVRGLYRSVTLQRRLELLPTEDNEVTHVSASIITGNALIIFSPDCNPRRVLMLIEQVALDHAAESRSADEDMPVTAKDRGSGETGLKLAPPQRVGSAEQVETGEERERQFSQPWHLIDKKFVLAAVNSSSVHGLSAEAAGKSLARHGCNLVPEPEPRSKLAILLGQFNSLPVALLAGAAVLSIATGGLVDAAVILAVVGINAAIGFVTESDAEHTIQSLKTLIRPYARVIREGKLQEISAKQVLIGDLLVLSPGVYVAADARVIEASHLTVDESVLTGESMPAVKNSASLSGSRIPLGDRTNMVYSGTLVTGGQGIAVVVGIGSFSEMGKIQALVAQAEAPETPIERQLGIIGNQLVLISGGICGLVFLIGLLRGNGVLQMLKTSISLAIAAVPEGLPAVATTAFVLGIKHMRRHKVLVRNLDAICTLGSIQTICLDKTGTITKNRMSVLRVACGTEHIVRKNGSFARQAGGELSKEPEEFLKLLHMSVLCSETQIEANGGNFGLKGSSTENALVWMAISCGVDVVRLRDEYPRLTTSYRSDDRQFMSTSHSMDSNGTLVALKGNPGEVLAKCSYQLVNSETLILTDGDRDRIENENDRMAGDSLRVLGVAYATYPAEQTANGDNDFVWLGLVGMADPIRERVKESIEVFHRAGLETVMITGDQSPTAYAVGKELALSNGKPLEILDSTSLTDTNPSVMKALSKQVHVFSRVSPSNKLQIVQALQATGQVVAMTGDGINDGPALKAADIGIAMGRGGTDVAREVADVVLEEDDLETLIIAVRDGRTIYNNIRKTLHYLLATNFSEIQVMFVAGALGLGYPLNAMQLLWINLISDIFPGLALTMEPAEPDVMERPPRDPAEPIVKTGDFKRITFEAATMTTTALAAYGYGIAKYGMGATAGTLAFHTLTTSQVLHALSCRSETHSVFELTDSPPNRYLHVAILGSLGLQLATQFIPGLRSLLGITPITLFDGLVIGSASVVPLLITEATKRKDGVE